MINCPKCKSEIDPDSRFCDQCGQEIFYCSQCRRPGKGLRCTTCGGEMRRYDELQSPSTQADSDVSDSITERESMMAAAIGATYRAGIPQLFLVNDSLHLRIAGTNGAIIGRRSGIYSQHLLQYNYISGTHAQLHYNQNRWLIEDKNSSNGTFVNGNRLAAGQATPLAPGDLVQLANIEFRVEISQR